MTEDTRGIDTLFGQLFLSPDEDTWQDDTRNHAEPEKCGYRAEPAKEEQYADHGGIANERT